MAKDSDDVARSLGKDMNKPQRKSCIRQRRHRRPRAWV